MTQTTWNIEALTGYQPKTTFWSDFTIADAFGKSAVIDTFNRAFSEWKFNYIYLTELVMVLNWKAWQHYENQNEELQMLYVNLYERANDYALNTLTEDELSYFYKTTD